MSKRKTTSVHLRLNDDLMHHIDTFRSKYFFNNRTEALRYLIALGLNYHDKADYLMQIPNSKED